MSERKASQYLKYAVGEILLVAIGILIALYLNNLNQNSKDYQEELYLLESFNRQLAEDLETLEKCISETEERGKNIIRIVKMLENPKEIDLVEFIGLQIEITRDDYFVSSRGTFDEAVSSGKLKFIRDHQLREKLFHYYNEIANERDNDKLQYKTTNEYVTPIMVQEVFTSKEIFEGFTQAKIKLPPLDLEKLARNKRYFEAITYTLGDQFQLDAWHEYKELAKDLKSEVEKMLKHYGVKLAD